MNILMASRWEHHSGHCLLMSVMDPLKKLWYMKAKCLHFTRDTLTTHLTLVPDTTSEATFLQVLNNCHSSLTFTMETESNGLLSFQGMQLHNGDAQIETRVYVKPTNTALLLHCQSHVDMRYKRGLLKTMLDRAYLLLLFNKL